MQIHLALKEPPAWKNQELSGVALVHVTDGLEGISRATNEGTRGQLPVTSTIAVGQPHTSIRLGFRRGRAFCGSRFWTCRGTLRATPRRRLQFAATGNGQRACAKNLRIE